MLLTIDELNKLTRSTNGEHLGSAHYKTIESVQKLWVRLLATLNHPSVSDKHMTAACNGICFTARTASRSSNPDVRSFAYSSHTWTQTFDAARCAFASSKNKPGLQVLDTLVYLADSTPDRYQTSGAVAHAATEMIRIIFNQYPKTSLKEACIVLYFFIRKLSGFVSLPDVLEQGYQETRPNFMRLCHGSQVAWQDLVEDPSTRWFAFVLSLLMVVRIAESKSATLKLLALLCNLPPSITGVDNIAIVNRAIEVYGAANESALEEVSRDVLPSILTEAEQYTAFLTKQGSKADSKQATVQVILALLQFGKRQGYVSEEGT